LKVVLILYTVVRIEEFYVGEHRFMVYKYPIIVISCFIFSSLLHANPLSLSVHAESAIMINAETGAILYEKKANILQFPASITKIATCLYVLKTNGAKLDEMITAQPEAVASVTEEAKRRSNYTLPAYWLVPGGTHMGIKNGEVLSLRHLLLGMMLVSANDASNVVAQYSGGTVSNFMNNLNSYLKELGCKNTTFYNPHGLHHPHHQTTAYDMALITKEALKHPVFREIVSTIKFLRPKTNKQDSTTLLQGNKLLRPGKFFYEKAIGVKTGHLALARHTFVGAATDGERTLIAVLLKTQERENMFLDAKMMFETAFNQTKIQRRLLKSGSQSYTAIALEGEQPVKSYIKHDVNILYYPAEEPEIKCFLSWDSLHAPIEKDQKIGNLTLRTSEGKVLQTVSLFAEENVPLASTAKLKEIFKTAQQFPYLKVGGVILVFIFGGWIILRFKRN
jgi:serine-type D-Ala-D-Ala carboxypeptidase (penicillin-binding protein 5/6)